jgi:hypothetical protein
MHTGLVLCTINVLYHISPLTWGTCILYPSWIVRLIANSLYAAHGTCACVSDPDTININVYLHLQLRVYQTTCTPCIMYHNWLLLLAIVSLVYRPNTLRCEWWLNWCNFHVSGDWVHGHDMARSHDLPVPHMNLNLRHAICITYIVDKHAVAWTGCLFLCDLRWECRGICDPVKCTLVPMLDAKTDHGNVTRAFSWKTQTGKDNRKYLAVKQAKKY